MIDKDTKKVICINTFCIDGMPGYKYYQNSIYECKYVRLLNQRFDGLFVEQVNSKYSAYAFYMDDKELIDNFVDYKVYERRNKLSKVDG